MPALADALAIGAEINRAYLTLETQHRNQLEAFRLVSCLEYTVGAVRP